MLLLLVPLLACYGVVLARGGYATGAFWAAPWDAKLDHIVDHRREWAWMHALWIGILAVVVAGGTAFAALLADAGEEAPAVLALGAFLLGAFAWLVGILLQGGPVDVAARARRETGATPGWLRALTAAVGRAEVAYIVLASTAYLVWGTAMVDAGFPAVWAGWASIALAVLSLTGLVLAPSRMTFPELPLLVPVVVGIALVLD